MKQNIWCWITVSAIVLTILYISFHAKEHFSRPNPDYITFDPKSTATNPFGKVAQVMFNLQSPRDCDDVKKAVLENPYPTQEEVDALFECTHNPYDRMLIKTSPSERVPAVKENRRFSLTLSLIVNTAKFFLYNFIVVFLSRTIVASLWQEISGLLKSLAKIIVL